MVLKHHTRLCTVLCYRPIDALFYSRQWFQTTTLTAPLNSVVMPEIWRN